MRYASALSCEGCGGENRPGRKFCSACGKPLARVCPACRAANEPDDSFCGECGAALEPQPAAALRPLQEAPAAECRLVSVLFADLVGFTSLSELRDPEEVRELLSRYFEEARRVIARYGGTVEKFIGDAVTAVWGTPVAQEDDAERAVRTALELVGAVGALGAEVGASELRLRAGVVTGEAAVTIGAEGQGMVAGDLVNTAARVQSVAAPGTALVGETTRRASEAAIAYEDAGEHELKGKAEPVSLWRALRVIATRGGEGRSTGLEAPFVGRDSQFRHIRDLFHATADEGKARLVSVVGVAGIGKSRLAWEFEKYIDGLVDTIWWQRGRCLAYGEGVAYWALAEMVRMRARIAEDEAPESAVAKLRATIEENVPDPEERSWIEPRLAHLLGLAERTAPDREDLFSAWRLFFERLAERHPAVLLFEDIQWADTGLLDFIEYLLDWSRNHPLYVLTLSRPELADRHPTWGAGKRNFTSLFLEPLPDEAMDDLLRGLVPGLPEDVRTRIRTRAEGVPLYAVETVRMLLDRGLLEQRGNEYGLAGPIEALEVPETLHALIAARLDGLAPVERRLLEDASVLGKTFTTRALAAVSGYHVTEVEPLLTSLLRKEVLSLQTDPRSPERGQYGFLQALVQKVAYDTLARKERKTRHLKAAAYLESGLGPDEEEIAEVLAAHYLEAYNAAPDADDADEIKARARDHLTRAAGRAASLAANEEAQRCFEQAARLADEPLVRAELEERAGMVTWMDGRAEEAGAHFEQAIALFAAEGATHPAARVSARLAETMHGRGRLEEAIERMERSFQVLSGDEPDADLGALAAQLARLQYLAGENALAAERIELALEIAESLRLPELVSQALNTKGMILSRRPYESQALLEQALKVALDNDLPAAALRAYYNLSYLADLQGRYGDSLEYVGNGLALARKRGDRSWEWRMLIGLVESLYIVGEWSEALARFAEIPEEAPVGSMLSSISSTVARIHVDQGGLLEAQRVFEPAETVETVEVQEGAGIEYARAVVRRGEGRHGEALAAAEQSLALFRGLHNTASAAEAFVEAGEAAFALDDLGKVEQLLRDCEGLPPVERTQYLEAHMNRFRARLAAGRGESDRTEQTFGDAVALFRELGMPFWLAVSLLEQGEWLAGRDRIAEAVPILDEAGEVFTRLRATPWLARVAAVGTSGAVPAGARG